MEVLETYLRTFPCHVYSKGEIVISQGEVPRSAYFIQKGLIKTYNLTTGGQERLIDINIPGDIFPDTWTFGKSSCAIYFYEALTDCSLYVVPRDSLMKIIDGNAGLQRSLLDKYVTAAVTQYLRIDALTNATAAEKLLQMLRYLSLRFGETKSDKTVEIKIYLNHTVLSDLMGISRETATKELIKLKARGIIDYDRRRLMLDPAKLSEAIGDTDYNEVTLDRYVAFA